MYCFVPLRPVMKQPDFQDLILFEDDDYLVINKPPFLATLDERVGGAPNMLRLARQHHDDMQACHRLDRETSRRAGLRQKPRGLPPPGHAV